MCNCKKATICYIENDLTNIVKIETDQFTIDISDSYIFEESGHDLLCKHNEKIITSNQIEDLKILCTSTKKVKIILNYLKKLGYTFIYKAIPRAFTKFIFPILRNVFPNLIARKLVSVQPITSEISKIFELDFKYNV